MSEGQLTKVKIAPGITRKSTEYASEGAWVSCDKVRWHKDVPEKIGGWAEKNTSNYPRGVVRAIKPFAALDGSQYVAIGTHNSLWIESGGTYYDITPIRASVAPAQSSIFSGVAGSHIVKASINSHGGQVNDLVRLDNTVSMGGGDQYLVSGLYRITSANTNTFTVSAPMVATSTYTNDGATASVQFLINTGLKSNGALYGWGAGGWGQEAWGTPRTNSGVATELRQWNIEPWGEDLLCQQKDGSLYYFETSTLQAGNINRASVVNNAPTKNHFMFLSNPARHVVLCGTCVPGGDFDPMLVRWSDSNDYTEWTAAATNGSNNFRLQQGSMIVGALTAKKEHVIFTDEGAYTMTYTGTPYYFGFERLGTNCGLLGFNAGIDIQGTLFWMSETGFFIYDGTVRELPSTLDEAIFSEDDPVRINLAQKEKTVCGANSRFSEIWWFYPAGESEENSRYIVYNYENQSWYDGNLVRTTWIDSGIFDNPIATDSASVSAAYFVHETGYNNVKSESRGGVSVIPAFLKSGELQIEEGDQMLFIDQYVPDFEQTVPMKIIFNTKKYPQSNEIFTKGPYTINPGQGKLSLRLRGRSFNLQVQCTIEDSFFRIGDHRIRIQPDGER